MMKIKDLTNGEVFEYGESHHHALRISGDGMSLYFEHLQNGDGSFCGEYRFVDDFEEKIPDETETVKRYGADCYFNIGGFDTAYAPDKVVEQLESMFGCDPMYFGEDAKWAVDRAIEIVKKGGVADET